MPVVDRPASVSNLIIKSAEMERDGNLNCGILASFSHPNATISDVVVQGTIKSTGSGAHSIVAGGAVGEYRGTATDLKVIVDINVVDAGASASIGGAFGIAGEAEIKDITYSSYNGSITMPSGQFSHSVKIGGFTGQLSGNGISKCFARVNNTIVANAANFMAAGGFVAYIADDPSELDNCYAFADIGYCQSGANNAKVGGFIGYIDGGGSIGLKHAYCVGAIDVGNDEYGGFCGVNDGYGGFNSCFYDYGRAGTRTSDGGTWKTQAEMKTKSTFIGAGWDFRTIWGIREIFNDGYPHFLTAYNTIKEINGIPWEDIKEINGKPKEDIRTVIGLPTRVWR